jgi:hypothetical protein
MTCGVGEVVSQLSAAGVNLIAYSWPTGEDARL